MMVNPFGSDRSVDKPFVRYLDFKSFTVALVMSHYRPYALRRADNGMVEIVWAKSEEAVTQRYFPGEVVRMSADHLEAAYPIVVVVDAADGGGINRNGVRDTSS